MGSGLQFTNTLENSQDSLSPLLTCQHSGSEFTSLPMEVLPYQKTFNQNIPHAPYFALFGDYQLLQRKYPKPRIEQRSEELSIKWIFNEGEL